MYRFNSRNGTWSDQWVDGVCVKVKLKPGETATLILDNLLMAPTSNAPGLFTNPCIDIADTGGTVIISSAAGSTNVLKGRGDSPVINKEGTKTELRFQTEDPDNPGMIKLYASSKTTNEQPAIGVSSYFITIFTPAPIPTPVPKTTGNIHFDSGSIEAYGSTGYGLSCGGPGIGGGRACSVDGITFNGGSVLAVAGGSSSAAIGTCNTLAQTTG